MGLEWAGGGGGAKEAREGGHRGGQARGEKLPGEEEVEVSAGLNSSIKLLRLHGSMKQADRLRVFQDFRKSTSGVLLCTDVAARGLDLPQVGHDYFYYCCYYCCTS